MPYLISIAIGPVQEFIATARRSRDLWFGSWLLSELSKAAAKIIADVDEKRLIFPAVQNLDDLNPANRKLETDDYFSVVNKITAKIETNDPTKFAQDVYGAMKHRLNVLRKEAFEKLPDEYFDSDQAIKQTDDLIEYYFAAVPLPDENEYPKIRLQVEALLTARKNTRNFASTKDWAQEGVPKSSLDGLRESVIKKKAFDELSDVERRQLFETRPGERLCGVGLLKRLGNWKEQEGFFSTSHVAAFPLLSNLQETDSVSVAQYFEKLKGIDKSAWGSVSGNGSSKVHQLIAKVFQKSGKPCDGRLLFEDRLAEYFEKKNVPPDIQKAKINTAKTALRSFLKLALGDRKPNPYYALLLADGDGMGKAIEGLKTPDEHRELSSKLSDFAKSVRAIVETHHHGSLIYAGGDDVLAFVPLHTIVQCAKALSDEFKTIVSNGTTLSVGVAICHHLDPLSDGLTLAREAEKEAKRFPNKNALCIKLDKRGGETTTVIDHWGNLDERLKFFTLLFVADKLPDGVAYEFQKLAHQLEQVPDAIAGEVKRILKRKRAGHGKSLLDEAVIQKVQAALTAIGQINGLKKPLERLAQELIVARALATAQEQSHATLELAQTNAQQALAGLLAISDASNDEDGGNDADLVD